MTVDDREQHNELLANGTLCYGCGNLIESLVGEDKILKTPSGKAELCKKCNVEVNKTSPKRMDTGYEVDITPTGREIRVNFKSPLEEEFMPVEAGEER